MYEIHNTSLSLTHIAIFFLKEINEAFEFEFSSGSFFYYSLAFLWEFAFSTREKKRKPFKFTERNRLKQSGLGSSKEDHPSKKHDFFISPNSATLFLSHYADWFATSKEKRTKREFQI